MEEEERMQENAIEEKQEEAENVTLQEQQKGNDGYQSTICSNTISTMVKHSIGGKEM